VKEQEILRARTSLFRKPSKLYRLDQDFPHIKCYKWRSNAQTSPEITWTVTVVKQIALGCTLGPSSTTVQQDEGRAEKRSENDNFEGKRSRAILKQHMYLTFYIASFRPIFLNRRAAARYRALASIIPGRERPKETTICYKISLVQVITNLNVILGYFM